MHLEALFVNVIQKIFRYLSVESYNSIIVFYFGIV